MQLCRGQLTVAGGQGEHEPSRNTFTSRCHTKSNAGPTMSNRFEARKHKILEQLSAPDGEYQDLSPKGSVDEPIRDLIDEINSLDGLVTTSSCSGRISVFLEGRKTDSESAQLPEDGVESRAGPGGKGGGAWLYISHSPLETPEATHGSTLMSTFGFQNTTTEEGSTPDSQSRYIHLKFEPMILHVSTASFTHAQRVLTAALSAGFRESGAVSLDTKKSTEVNPMVAVRSAGYSFDSIIGYQDEEGQNIALVNELYLQTLVRIANDRFKINTERIARLRAALMDSHCSSNAVSSGTSKPDWEDADVRKRRKREEGLARQRALQAQDSLGDADPGTCPTDVQTPDGIL
ncbi:hypothetical protein P153DRAFT_430144 [Dothidotthia symphoricarpi CBS 119687]|uniref:tRNA wybutosine-synthesizing protein 3 n=1 Tax=Dothidotthia symphoricarpi CBS 119687 TaxID=1392245 RepID=A0A6A6AID6_9PLEO|nr:uncharacterized protein P153DRAFT_430144 [Dothidotthia symphoricarpi CBS 119687]KAF2130838.1 hypothetical protein P153DRAFT_430144 [Dothidotthia symphoricarpi CBS 119687]